MRFFHEIAKRIILPTAARFRSQQQTVSHPIQSGMANSVGESVDQTRADLAKVKTLSASNLLLFWVVLTNVVA
jgi:hypothetical protein